MKKKLTSSGVLIYRQQEYKTINIPLDLHTRLKAYCQQEGQSISNVATIAIHCFINRAPAPDKVVDVTTFQEIKEWSGELNKSVDLQPI